MTIRPTTNKTCDKIETVTSEKPARADMMTAQRIPGVSRGISMKPPLGAGDVIGFFKIVGIVGGAEAQSDGNQTDGNRKKPHRFFLC